MNANNQSPNTQPAADGSSEIANARATQIANAIARLDKCAGRLNEFRETLNEDLYTDLVSQAYIYASFLTDCKEMSMSLQDPRIREATKEMALFCDFIEEEFGI